MHLRLYASPTVQIGGGTDASLPVYRCTMRATPISYGDREVSSATVTLSAPGAELRGILSAAPLGAVAEMRDDSGVLFAGVLQSISVERSEWSLGVEV